MAEDQTDLNSEAVAQDQQANEPEQQQGRHRYTQRENVLRMKEVIAEQSRRIRDLEERSFSREQEEPENYSPDDSVDMKTLKKGLTKAEQNLLQKLEPMIDKKLKDREVESFLQKAPDYWDVIDEYLPQLQKNYPQLARLLENHPQDSVAGAYEAIVNAPWYKGNKQVVQSPGRQKAPKSVEPPSGMSAGSGSPALHQARSYQNMQVGDDLWAQYVKDSGYAG